MTINKYIEQHLLHEYARKSFVDGYSLDVNDLPKHEIANFLETLFQTDFSFKEIVMEYMQGMIDSRLPIYETQDRYDSGLVPVQDRQTGEFNWIPSQNYIAQKRGEL